MSASAAPSSMLSHISGNVVLEIPEHDVWRQFHEVIVNILEDVEYQVVYSPHKFTGLEISTMNGTHTCMIQARLSGMVEVRDTSMTSFRIDAKTFHATLKLATPDDTVVLQINDDEIRVLFMGTSGSSKGGGISIPRKISSGDQGAVFPTVLFKYTIQFRQAFFRKYIKMFAEFKVEHVEFCLYRPRQSGHGLTVEDMVFAFRGRSDKVNRMDFHFPSKPRQLDTAGVAGSEQAESHFSVADNNTAPPPSTDAGLMNMRSSDGAGVLDLDSMEELYRAPYKTRYLEHFTKTIDRHDITLYLGPERPLMLIHFPVGDVSYVRFILMQCILDGDEDMH